MQVTSPFLPNSILNEIFTAHDDSPASEDEFGMFKTILAVSSFVLSAIPFAFSLASPVLFTFQLTTYILNSASAGLDLHQISLDWGRPMSPMEQRMAYFSLIGRVCSLAFGVLSIIALTVGLPILPPIALSILFIGLVFDVMVFLNREGWIRSSASATTT